MELERGQCFCCSGASGYKILVHEKPELCNKLFIHLFGEVIFEEAREKLVRLKWCPVCFQKVLLVLKDSDTFENLKSNIEGDHCLMCKNNEYIVNIESWPHLVKILEEFGEVIGSKICLNCIYILDMRNMIRQKISIRYPQLKAQNRRLQPSSEPSPASTKRTRPKRTSAVIEISDDETLTKSSISNITVFQKLKPLKIDGVYGNIEIIHNDPKFFSQIPYTRLQLFSTKNNSKTRRTQRNEEIEKNKREAEGSPKRNSYFKIKLKSHNNRYSIVKETKSSRKKRKSVSFYSEEDELKKHNISNSLIVNIDKDKSCEIDVENINMDTTEDTSDTEKSTADESNDKIESQNSERSTAGGESTEENESRSKEELLEEPTETNEVQNESLETEIKPKKYRPKPRSKQKKENLVEEVEKSTEKENGEKKDSEKPCEDEEEGEKKTRLRQRTENVEKSNEDVLKKRKPGPLSKRKRRESRHTREENDETEKTDEINDVSMEKDDKEENEEKETVNKKTDEQETEETEEDAEVEQSQTIDGKETDQETPQRKDFATNHPEENKGNEGVEIEDNQNEEKENNENEEKEHNENEEKEHNENEEKEDTENVEKDDNEETEKEDKDVTENEETVNKEDEEMDDENEKEVEKNVDNGERIGEAKSGDDDQGNEPVTDDLAEEAKKIEEETSEEISNGDETKAKTDENSEKEQNGVGNKDDNDDKIDLNEFDDSSNSNKRKCDSENVEGIFSPDKKKKRVTFSDEVLESSID